MRAQRKDKNHQFIAAVFAGMGHYAQDMDRTEGFDMLVHGTFGPWVVEVKSGPKEKLTDNEKAKKAAIETADGRYHIVVTGFDALGILGLTVGDLITRQRLEIMGRIDRLKKIDEDVQPMVDEFYRALAAPF